MGISIWDMKFNLNKCADMNHLMTKPTKIICAPSEDSDQPGHQPSLIRVFAMSSMGSWRPSVSSCGQRRLWSDWADTQADLSLRWAHRPFCWFCHEAAHISNYKFVTCACEFILVCFFFHYIGRCSESFTRNSQWRAVLSPWRTNGWTGDARKTGTSRHCGYFTTTDGVWGRGWYQTSYTLHRQGECF